MIHYPLTPATSWVRLRHRSSGKPWYVSRRLNGWVGVHALGQPAAEVVFERYRREEHPAPAPHVVLLDGSKQAPVYFEAEHDEIALANLTRNELRAAVALAGKIGFPDYALAAQAELVQRRLPAGHLKVIRNVPRPDGEIVALEGQLPMKLSLEEATALLEHVELEAVGDAFTRERRTDPESTLKGTHRLSALWVEGTQDDLILMARVDLRDTADAKELAVRLREVRWTDFDGGYHEEEQALGELFRPEQGPGFLVHVRVFAPPSQYVGLDWPVIDGWKVERVPLGAMMDVGVQPPKRNHMRAPRSPVLPSEPVLQAELDRLADVVPMRNPHDLWGRMLVADTQHPGMGFFDGLEVPTTTPRAPYVLAGAVWDIEAQEGRPVDYGTTLKPLRRAEMRSCLTRRLLDHHPMLEVADVVLMEPTLKRTFLTERVTLTPQVYTDMAAAGLDVEVEFTTAVVEQLRLRLWRELMLHCVNSRSYGVAVQPWESLVGLLARAARLLRIGDIEDPIVWAVCPPEVYRRIERMAFLDATAHRLILTVALADGRDLKVHLHEDPFFPVDTVLVGWADPTHTYSPLRVHVGAVDFQGDSLTDSGKESQLLTVPGFIPLWEDGPSFIRLNLSKPESADGA